MKKIIFGFVLIMILFANGDSLKVYAATAESAFTYEVKEDGTATITACTATGDIVIPETLGGYTVTELAPKLFYGVRGITSVYIPRTVTTIGMWSYVFSYCPNLTAIYVDEDNEAFCSDDGVLYDKKKEVLYNYPCAKKLRLYTIPDTVHSICCTAFAAAWDLEILCIEGKDSVWATYTFYNTDDLKIYYRPSGKSEECANQHQKNGLCDESNWVYPAYVSWSCTEEDHANKNNWKLVDAFEATCISEGSTGSWCCSECGMEIVPAETIEEKPHSYSEWETQIAPTCAQEGESVKTCSYCGVQQTKMLPRLTEHSYGEWETITEPTCGEVGEAARICRVCSKTEWMEIPAIGYIVGEHFVCENHIYKIKSINGQKGTLVYQGEKEEDIYRSFKIPKIIKMDGKTFTVTEIGKDALKGNTLIKSVTIPSTVTKIGQGAFMNCKNLKYLDIKSSKLKKVGKNAIKGAHKRLKIYVPKKKVKKYKKLFKKNTGYKKTMKVRKIWL